MSQKNSFIKFIKFFGITFLIGLASILITHELLDSYNSVNNRIKKMREDYISQQKEIIKQEVHHVVDLINYKTNKSNKIGEEIKRELLEIISRIRFGKEGYIFVNKLNGNALVSNGKILSGNKKLWEEFPSNSEKIKTIFNMEYAAAQKTDGDFIYYNFIKLTNSKKESPKVSFVHGVKNLGWLVGAGVYLDDIEKNIALLQDDLEKQTINRLLYSFTVIIIVIIIFLFFLNIFSKRLSSDFKQFNTFFTNAAYKDKPIDLKEIKFLEFENMAESANKMLADKIKAQKELIAERQQLFITIHSIGDGLITTDNKGRIVLMNKVAEKLTGWSNEEAKGLYLEDVFKIINESSREKVENPIKKVLSNGEIVGLANHTILVSKDGTEYNIGDSAAPIKDANNNISGVVFVFRDVTKEYRIRKTLKESEEYFRTLIEYSSDVVSIFDKEGIIKYASPSHKNVLGHEPEEFLGKNIFDIVYPDDIERVQKYLEEGLKVSNTLKNITFRIYHKDGSLRCMEGTGRNLLETSNINGIVVNYRDITERVKYEKEREIFQRLTKELSMPLTLYSAAKIIAEEAYKLFEYDAFSFDVVDKISQSLIGIYNEDTKAGKTKPEETKAESHKLKEVRNKDVALKGVSKLINRDNNIESYDFEPFGFNNRLSSSLMFVPIKYLDEIVGILSIQSYKKHKYDNADLRLLEKFVDHIGRAIIRIQIEEKLKESELRLKSLINATPDIICFKDGKGRWMVANRANLELFGLGKVDYFGKTDAELADFTNPIYKEIFLSCMESDEKAWEKGSISRVEEVIPTVDGEEKIYDIIKVPVFEKDGARSGLVVLGRDVTENKKIEERLEILSKAVQQSPTSIVITNPDGDIEYVNPKFTEVTGYTFEEVYGKNSRILKSGTHPKEFFEELWNTLLLKTEWRGEFHNKRKNGELYWELASISPITDENGKIVHFVAIKEDITEKKKMVEELIEAKERAESADKMKSIFLAQMSHEIRTPINALVSMSSLLRYDFENNASEDQLMSFDIIDRAGNRIIRTVDLLLNLSEIQAGTYEVNPNKFDIYAEVLSVVVAENKKYAEMKGLTLKLNCLASDTELISDSYTVNQIFVQLVDNAIKYTEKGEIIISLYRNENNYLVVEVKDTGIGIDEEYLPSLFEPFSQEEMGYTRKYEGNGIGMALVKKYCELNNAKIEVKSKKGVGSTFRVIFIT